MHLRDHLAVPVDDDRVRRALEVEEVADGEPRIEGDRNNRIQPVTYPFRKIECPARVEGPTALARKALQLKYDDMVAREMSYVGGINGWFSANAGPTFRHVMWTTTSEFAPVASAATLGRADSAMKANQNRTITDRKMTAILEQVWARG